MFFLTLPTHVPPTQASSTQPAASMTEISRDSQTDAGEPLQYLSTANPEVSANIMTIHEGGKTDWMTHPAPGYLYILQGTLTVEFEDGTKITFHAGQGFLQARTKWHRGINSGTGDMKFLAVFFGAKGLPTVVHPPKELDPMQNGHSAMQGH